MPTVIGINQVPREIVRPKWYADAGYAGGSLARAMLLASMGGGGGGLGQKPTTPSASNPGTFNFPQGSQSPLEAAQIQQMGGVPTNQGWLAKSTTSAGPGGVSWTPDTKLGIKPNIDWQIKQAALEKSKQELDPDSPMNRQMKEILERAYPKPADQSQPQQDETGFFRGLSNLSQRAQSGDEDAVTKIRLIRQMMQE